MPFNPQAIYQEILQWNLKMAHHPGWKAYIWNNIQEIDADPSGLFTGIKDDFLKQIQRKNDESIFD